MDDQIKKRFEEIEEKIRKLEETIPSKKEETPEQISPKEIFDIEDEKLTLTVSLGEKDGEKTQNISLLVLLGYKEKLRKEKVLASEIKRNVALNGVPIENFSTYLNKLIPRYMLRIGKPKSTKTEYKLTPFGEAQAKNLLKELP